MHTYTVNYLRNFNDFYAMIQRCLQCSGSSDDVYGVNWCSVLDWQLKYLQSEQNCNSS